MNRILSLLSLALALAAGDDLYAKPASTQAAVSFYRLRLELSTTARAAKVTARATENFLTARLMGTNGNPAKKGATMNSLWVAQETAGNAISVTVDCAVKPEALAAPVPYLFEQMREGASVLRVFNVVGNQTELLAEIHHTGTNPAVFSLDLSALKNTPALVGATPRIAAQKMLWAFYYQWYFSGGWDLSILQDAPQLGYYESSDSVLIARHIEQAQSAGINGFIASWWGPPLKPKPNPTPLEILLNLARDRDFFVMINFETVEFDPVTREAIPRDKETILNWLRYAISHYGSHPAFMKVEGKPVFVIYLSHLVPDSTWQSIFTQLRRENLDATFIADYAGEWPKLDGLTLFDGMHTYSILNVVQSNSQVADTLVPAYERAGRCVRHYSLLADSAAPKIWTATVQPGYDDHLIPGRATPILPRENGALYRATFAAATASDPDWIFITSWNEWWEHTYIEPSRNYGGQYLQITHELAGQWRNPTSVSHRRLVLPKNFKLEQNYPNPFNPATVISFQLSVSSHVSLKVFDVTGREVATLVDDEMTAGNHSVRFAPRDVAGGLYFYQLTAGKFSQTRKAVVIK